MAATNNGHLPNMEDGEDKPMLVIKKPGDSPGITALINRQFQGTVIIIQIFVLTPEKMKNSIS